MLEMFLKMQNKRHAKGGFTLVELIVVLVILAILAALLIPALTGYIDKAKEKSIIAETRSVVMAAQTLYDEQFANVKLDKNADITFGNDANNTIKLSDVAKLAEVTKDNIKSITADNNRTTGSDSNKTDNANFGKITKVEYTRDGKTCTYDTSTSAKELYTVTAAKSK